MIPLLNLTPQGEVLRTAQIQILFISQERFTPGIWLIGPLKWMELTLFGDLPRIRIRIRPAAQMVDRLRIALQLLLAQKVIACILIVY